MRYAKGPSGAARPRVATEALERRVLFAAELVAELHPGTLGSTPADSQSENLLGFEQAGGRVYYLASDGIHGDEIWSSDGTAAGSGMVADISPGAANTRLQQPRTAGGLLYFVRLADTPFGFRYELWRTNGTPAGTFRLRDVAGTTPTLPTESLGKLFYAAPVTGGNGYAVYATDGTVAGTTTVSSSPTPITAMDGTADELIFAADNSVYRYDGTPPVKLRAGTTLTSIFTMQGYAVVQQSTDTRPYALNTETGDLTLLSVGGRRRVLRGCRTIAWRFPPVRGLG
jgi:ELWxxDGT repeat protein